MTEEIILNIDGQQVTVELDTTLLDAAKQIGVDIPTICWHEATTSNGLCRLCVVEVEGQRVLQPSCIVKAADGMKVQTRSERVMRTRKTILEMLASSVDLSEFSRHSDHDRRIRRISRAFPGGRAARDRSQG